jgi:hypothetical protein
MGFFNMDKKPLSTPEEDYAHGMYHDIIQVASIGKGQLIAINVARASMVRRRAPAQIVGRPA